MMSDLALADNQNTPITAKYPTDTTNLVLAQITMDISQPAIRNTIYDKAQLSGNRIYHSNNF